MPKQPKAGLHRGSIVLRPMAITYYKRFRMEIELDGSLPPPTLPRPFRFVPWDDDRLKDHAEVKYLCFRGEMDSQVFPCLGDLNGCLRLMREIRRKTGFLPGATWLIAGPEGFVATIQGVMTGGGTTGAIQNVGVVPSHRGLGLGRCLVRQALEGFYQAGLRRAFLEVTAENAAAIQLYRALGFRKAKTLYRAVGN